MTALSYPGRKGQSWDLNPELSEGRFFLCHMFTGCLWVGLSMMVSKVVIPKTWPLSSSLPEYV